MGFSLVISQSNIQSGPSPVSGVLQLPYEPNRTSSLVQNHISRGRRLTSFSDFPYRIFTEAPFAQSPEVISPGISIYPTRASPLRSLVYRLLSIFHRLVVE